MINWLKRKIKHFHDWRADPDGWLDHPEGYSTYYDTIGVEVKTLPEKGRRIERLLIVCAECGETSARFRKVPQVEEAGVNKEEIAEALHAEYHVFGSQIEIDTFEDALEVTQFVLDRLEETSESRVQDSTQTDG